MSFTSKEILLGARAAYQAVAKARGGSWVPYDQASDKTKAEFQYGAIAAAEAMQAERGRRIRANRAKRARKGGGK